MRIFLRGLTMTAALLSTTSSYSADEYDHSYVGDSNAEYYGEDSPYGNEAIVKNEASGDVQQASASAHVGDVPQAAPQGVKAASMSSPTTPTYRPAAMQHGQASMPCGTSPCGTPSCGTPSCESGCDVSCDSGCDAIGAFGAVMSGESNDIWMQAETLLWFPQARTSVPLAVLTGPGAFPLVTDPNAVNIGEEFGNNLSPGVRLDAGKYFSDGKFGVGGRVWYMSEDQDEFAINSDGTANSLGVPFFDIGSAAINQLANPTVGENAVLIGFQDGAVPGFVGGVSGESSLDMVAAEAYGRVSLARSKAFSLDLIGGYSYFGIDDDLSFNANFTRNPGTGSGSNFRDQFNASNDFHGGQIGAESILRRGRWVARSLTKVHLGNMSQQVDVSGDQFFRDAGGVVTRVGDGLFAGGLNGSYNEDRFAFAPEMNLKLGYRFRDHVTFTVGYSFLYWSSVALAGEQVDRNLAFDNTGVVAARDFTMKRDGFWVQGIDLGTTIEF